MVAAMMNLMDAQMHGLEIVYRDKTCKLSARIRSSSDRLIVFLHGWGGAKESFADAFSSDALMGYDICAIDLLGFGESDRPIDFSYDLLEQANIVALAINSFKANEVYLVGHSMGGGIGLLAAPSIKNLAIFINAESNLAPNGSGIDARVASRQPFWLFTSFTLPFIKLLLRLHPRPSTRLWAQWFGEASPYGLYGSIQSLVRWSDSGELLPRFKSLPQKAYLYSENGRRKKDVVPELGKSITYKVPACGHALMTDNPSGFYAMIADLIHKA